MLMRCTFTVAVVALAQSLALAAAPTTLKTKTESFDRDPGWDGVRNRVRLPAVRKQQDFGYRMSNHAGKAPGEFGGVVWRSTTPAYYGKKLPSLTMDQPLTASGTMTVLRSNTGKGFQTGSTIFIGFFNHEKQGWRPINFMGFRLEAHTDTEAKAIENRPGVELCYGTSSYAANGDFLNATGEAQNRIVKEMNQDTLRRIPPDGSKHTWEIRYDPKGDDHRTGLITLVLDGVQSTCRIPRWHRPPGATFDRFGIFNNQIAGDFMEAYFDDITINGEREDFSSDPGWDGKGNSALIEDTRPYGAQDFGFSPGTRHAGGAKPGEMGGFFQSVDPWEKEFIGYYGDRVGRLTLEHKLIARGKLSSDEYSIDSTLALGWFNSTTERWPPKNFVGVLFDTLTDFGRLAQPLYGTSGDTGKSEPGDPVTFLPDGTDYDWTLEYDPDASGGRGAITFTMNGQTVRTTLAPGDRQKGADMDRFGVFNLSGANSKHCIVYFDDLTYTTGEP